MTLENVIYLVVMIGLFAASSVAAFIWYRIWRKKKWDRVK